MKEKDHTQGHMKKGLDPAQIILLLLSIRTFKLNTWYFVTGF